ncbi:MAG: DUF711 family protein [Anaerolineales bacterium]
MKIRSITGFIAPKHGVDTAAIGSLPNLVKEASAKLNRAGYEVQTTRLATTPFPQWIQPLTQSRAVEAAVEAEMAVTDSGFDFISLGPTSPDILESFHFVPEMLKETKISFLGGIAATRKAGIVMDALKACAEIIQKVSTLEANGFGNLRFATLANVPPGSPFFPAAYHIGSKLAFAFATQAADLAVHAFETASSIADGARSLTTSIEENGKQLAKIAEEFSRKYDIPFAGIDFSLAPFPEERDSLGAAFERMGVQAAGEHGSLAAAALLTQAIDAADFPRTGFNGLLLPPLEDSVLAKRAAEGRLAVGDLLLYSAVCGTGLDTIPLPGNVTVEQLSVLLLDVCALALRLDKPLTARLMPIPGKSAGDETQFDFPYFANTRVLELKSAGLSGLLAASENISIRPRS